MRCSLAFLASPVNSQERFSETTVAESLARKQASGRMACGVCISTRVRRAVVRGDAGVAMRRVIEDHLQGGGCSGSSGSRSSRSLDLVLVFGLRKGGNV